MATWQSANSSGVHPITQAVLGLSKAMFDPEPERLAQTRASQMAVDQAQIANYGANSRKLDSDTALNGQVLGARSGAEEAFNAASNPDGTLNPAKAGAIYANLMQGGGASGGDVSQLGNVLSQIMLGEDPASPGFVQNATTAMMRQGKTPDHNFAPTPGRADAVSARDAAEAKDQAVTTQGMQDATSRANTAATIANLFDMNTADNLQLGINNLNNNKTRVYGYDKQAETSTANAAARNQTALDIATGRNNTTLAVADGNNDTNKEIAGNRDKTTITVANLNNKSREGIAANQPMTLNEVKGHELMRLLESMTFDERKAYALALQAEEGPDAQWVIYQDDEGTPYAVDQNAATPVAVPVPVPGGGGLTKVGTPAAAAKPTTISASTADNLNDGVAAAFGSNDYEPNAQSAVATRAFQLYQQGDTASNLLPGNEAGAIAQAFSELIAVQPDSWIGGTPDAVLRSTLPQGAPAQAAPAQAAPSAPAAPAPAPVAPVAPQTATGPNGQKIQLINGQWVPVQ